jgi:hypothetical protein
MPRSEQQPPLQSGYFQSISFAANIDYEYESVTRSPSSIGSDTRHHPPNEMNREPTFTSLASSKSSITSWWKRRRTLSIWWWEFICCTIVVVALLAITVTLRVYEHKPLPEWRYGISINALLAIFTVIMKAAAGLTLAQGISHLKWTRLREPRSLRSFQYHDDAARGPWGAMQLLWNSKGQDIASLGALVTVLIVLLDPFSQQVVRFYPCSRTHDVIRAAIPRAQTYVGSAGTDGAYQGANLGYV